MARKPFQWVRDDEEPLKYSDDRPNRSVIKRAHRATVDLAGELVALDPAKLAALPLDDDQREALRHAKSIKSTNKAALARQVGHIAALLAEGDVAAIHDALGTHSGGRSDRDEALAVLERWRDRLLEGDAEVLSACIEAYPDVDRQRLRQLVSQAQSRARTPGPNLPAKKLYKLLRDAAGL